MALPLACERSYVTAAGFSIFGQGKQDSSRGLAVDGPQLGP